MWKFLRILLLLVVLLVVAVDAWLDRVHTQSWRDTLWVGIFPLNGDGTAQADEYVASLKLKDFAGIGGFFEREAHRYGVKLEQPLHVELYPQESQLPPALPAGAGAVAIAGRARLRHTRHGR